MLKPLDTTLVKSQDTFGEPGNCVAAFHSEPKDQPPVDPKVAGGFVYIRLLLGDVHRCAMLGRKAMHALWAYARAKRLSQQTGWGAIPKGMCPYWRLLVRHSFAKDGNTHIHLKKSIGDGASRYVAIPLSLLDVDPITATAYVVQHLFLRVAHLHGQSMGARERNRRLGANANCGGMALHLLAGAFGRTKQWASYIRRKMERAGLCVFQRRYREMSAEEAKAARYFGSTAHFATGGRGFEELVSECTELVPMHVDRKCIMAGDWLDKYLRRKGKRS